MTNKFIGREHELRQLRTLLERNIASFVVIKGRRFSKLSEAIDFVFSEYVY